MSWCRPTINHKVKTILTLPQTVSVFVCAFAQPRKGPFTFLMSACINAAPTRRAAVNFDIGDFTRKSVEKVHFWLNSDKNIYGHFIHEEPRTYCRSGDIDSPQKHRWATVNICTLLTDKQHFVCIATMVTRIHQSVTLICTLPNTSRSMPPMACDIPTKYYLQETAFPFAHLQYFRLSRNIQHLKVENVHYRVHKSSKAGRWILSRTRL